MIYLIDDSEIKNIDTTYLRQDRYKDIITIIDDMGQFDSHIGDYEKAQCIMVHKTFCNSNVVYDKMERVTQQGDCPIPFVAFSAGDNDNAVFNETSPQVIYGLKKAVFYERLKPFLDDFIDKGRANLRILAYGKDYAKILVRSCALDILRSIYGKDGIVRLDDVAGLASNPKFKRLVEQAQLNYGDLLEKLEDHPISFDRLRMNINGIVNSFNQYGKNIYPWK